MKSCNGTCPEGWMKTAANRSEKQQGGEIWTRNAYGMGTKSWGFSKMIRRIHMIGIIGAMDEEVGRLKEVMTDVEISKKAGMDFYKGRLQGKDAVVVRSGIGKVNAGICTQILADDFHVVSSAGKGCVVHLRKQLHGQTTSTHQ